VKLTVLAVALLTAAVLFAAPAYTDRDTDFGNQLHVYGIFGPRDYNAWIGKIGCKRLAIGVDRDAFASAKFVSDNLARGTTTQQTWQFLAAAVATYCPEQQPVLASAAQADHSSRGGAR
jgi:hypothetical protein